MKGQRTYQYTRVLRSFFNSSCLDRWADAPSYAAISCHQDGSAHSNSRLRGRKDRFRSVPIRSLRTGYI